MEYEKSPTTTTTFSRKMNNRSHSISFNANSFYDGVFASPANAKSPLVDYGEIFRGSGPSPSSIPFLDVPELNDGKIMVDVRSSKLDYSSVFGGFGASDFAVTPEEVIIKSDRKSVKKEDRKRNRKKGEKSSHVSPSNEGNNPTSSPEMVRMKHSDLSCDQTLPFNENGNTHLTQVLTMPGPSPTQLVDNMSPLQKIEMETPIPSVEKKPCNVDNEKVEATRKGDSKTEVEVENIFDRNGCNTPDSFTCKTNSYAENRDVKPPSSLQSTMNNENGISERLFGSKSGRSESVQTEGPDSPCSPTYFDAETDADSAAAESSSALKKAIEEAQVRMNIAKQMMERKKAGFRSCAKLKSCDEPKVEDKEDQKVDEIAEESRDNSSQILGGMLNSSQQSFSNEGDQHAKRARKMWKVPEELLKPTANHKPEETEEKDVEKLEEEQARRGRKHWELPVGIFKSVMNSKEQEPENLAPAKPETDTKQEGPPITESPFYTFGHIGSKIKCVVEAFTGSKVSQKDEKQVTEKENSTLTQVVEGEESDSQKRPAGIRVTETYLREVVETPQQTKSISETRIKEKSESTVCTFAEGSSQKMEEETGLQVQSACESEVCGVNDFQESPDRTYNALDVKGGKEIVSRPQEIFVGPDDTNTYVREVGEIPTAEQSLGKTHFDDCVGTMVSFTENISEPGNMNEVKETVHKAPRRRRVWTTSEDVYNMIKAPKENNRPWQLESVENETTGRSFPEEGVRIYDVSEETGSTSEQASDSGLQENWTVLKQMFRQMFQTADIKGDDETYCLVESEKGHLDIIDQKDGDENIKETADASYCQITGTDRYEHDTAETVQMDYEAFARTRENEDLELRQETYCRNEDGKVEMPSKMSLVHELIGEEQEAIGMDSDQEEEDVHDVFEESGWAQGEGISDVTEIKEHANSRAEMLECDRSETDSDKSGENFEQRPELAEGSKSDGSVDTDPSRSSSEMSHGESFNGEVGVEQDLCDQFPEKASSSSSTEHVEEIDSDSIQSGWSIVEEDDKFNSYVEESLGGHLQDGEASQAASKPEEVEESKNETDEIKTSHGEENNEQNTEQQGFECQENEIDRSNVEAADSSCCFPNGGEKIGAATYRNVKENDGEESCGSSMEEQGEAISDASQNEAELVEKHLKKKDEAKEKEREREKERAMVERAIREARERAFADAKERAGIAAMEKAKARAHRRGSSKKGSVEVNDKLSSAEKVSMQAKLKVERAAVERVLAEARERALEKALSGKSAAASQARNYGGSKSFGSSGERRGSSTSGTENKSSGPSTSSNQTAKGEPIQRSKARSERHQRTSERAAEALAEKKLRDLKAQKEQAERNRLAESLDADVKRWSSGKENNLRALLSTLQYILGAESGWKPIPLTDLVSSAAVRKAYRKATLYVHPDKLQQRGASTKQKYICEKVFDLLKEAWNKFGADER